MKPSSKNSIVTIANAIDLAAGIVTEIAGDDIGNTLNGTLLNAEDLNTILALRVQANFSNVLRVRT